MTITVIFTGGTIGSTVKGEWTTLSDASRFTLINGYRQRHGEEVTFVTSTPYTILSENLTATALNCLLDEVEKTERSGVDGIIVTHGTDTLPYTTAALWWRFAQPRCPIITVSANYPLEDSRTNGHANFAAAVAYIAAKKTPQVLAAYRNPDSGKTALHHGDRMYLQAELSEAVVSMDDAVAAWVDPAGGVTVNDSAPRVHRSLDGRYVSPSGVLMAAAVPDMGYPYTLDGVKAVLFRPFHSGTLNTADGQLEAFCRTAREQGVSLFISASGNEADYDSTAVFKEYGIRVLPRCTLAAAYMRLWLAVSSGEDPAAIEW